MPCVIQDWASGEVLTLAYMNAEAIDRTRETGELHLWSRSRDELWHKGATSGNMQKVRALRFDCDGDAVLALVEPAGPACHTGERTCFHNGELDLRAPHEALPDLERTLAERAADRPEGSYTAQLLDDPPLIGEKVMEEAEEVARAAREETDERVAEEAADVLYHLTVLLREPRARSRGRRGGAAWPSPLTQLRRPSPSLDEARELARRPQPHPGLRHTFIEDCETPVSAFLKLRGDGPGVPARVGRAGPARGPLVVHRLCARAACCAGRWATAATRTRSPPPRSRATAQAPLRRPAAVRRRRGRVLRLRLRAHRRAAAASRIRTSSACPTWR